MNTPRRPRVAILTCAAFPALYDEERALLPALQARGVDATAVVWSDASVDLASFDFVVFRSVWDYFERLSEFRGFLSRLASSGAPVLNPVAMVQWNLDKVYLLELAARGVRIVPTLLFKGAEKRNLGLILDDVGWSRAVIKPAVSGGAYKTWVVDRDSAAARDEDANEVASTVGLLVQPYLPQIKTEGEQSLIFFDNVFSHAVVKTPTADDFRVQFQFGGTFSRIEPSAEVLETAKRVLSALPEAPIYARVDGVVVDGLFHLMEVELIEPYLYFPVAPEAAERCADVIARHAMARPLTGRA